jgi:putative ABC transport system permease protein
MLFLEIIRVALEAIKANKMRSFLTMLGIIIGVAAVITMVALGEGAQRAVEEQIESLGTNVLNVRPGQGFSRGVRSGDAKLTVDDADALLRGAATIEAIAPELSRNQQVEAGRSNANLRITGTSESFPDVNSYEIAAGRFFTAEEDRGRRRVAVLGGDVPEVLDMSANELVGQTVRIRNIAFEVVGVLESKGGSGWWNADEQIFIPLRTAQFRVIGTDRISSINVTVADGASQGLAMAQIEDVLRRQHRLRPGKPNDFWVLDRAELLGTQQEATQTFGFLLAGIALVSLMVGGIGIMNIMLVSVTERTKEIGVRMAMGATRKAVLGQFLLEALVMCLLGGVIGIAVGIGASVLLSALANWNTVVSGQAVAIAVVFSLTVGVFFGIWPARRAARLDPIAALRYE